MGPAQFHLVIWGCCEQASSPSGYWLLIFSAIFLLHGLLYPNGSNSNLLQILPDLITDLWAAKDCSYENINGGGAVIC